MRGGFRHTASVGGGVHVHSGHGSLAPEALPPFDDFRVVFEASPDGILIIDGQGQIHELNPRALVMFGYAREEILGQSIEILVPKSVRGRHPEMRAGYMARPASRPMGAEMELRAVRRDGHEIPVEVALRPCEVRGHPFVMAVVRDVSETRRLRNLGTATLRATEDERQRIARELHDDTAQVLTALMLRLEVLSRIRDEEQRQVLMNEMHDDLSELVDGVRRLARGLRPPALEDVGVASAIRSHVRRAVEGTGVREVLDLDPVDRVLGPEAQLVVYRVVQEALSNVLRHAEATTVTISLKLEGAPGARQVVALVSDDGKGFEVDGIFLRGSGLGLIGMEERAKIAGGSLLLSSDPARGSRVRLRIPVKEAPEEARAPAPDQAAPDQATPDQATPDQATRGETAEAGA
jgi:PAS domain S-box-containing protein